MFSMFVNVLSLCAFMKEGLLMSLALNAWFISGVFHTFSVHGNNVKATPIIIFVCYGIKGLHF